ncbi:MAG TPA: serine hydrolase [Thermoanaerobaculia bacterium]|nr:serine hydrolase [Thermoanaerobaculia bacterium]
MARAGVRGLSFVALVLLVASGCATTGAGGGSSLDAAVDAASKRCACRIGVAVRHLESGKTYERNGDSEFESASVIKIAILTEAMAQVRDGKISLADRWTLTEEKKADGSGTLVILDPGLNPTWSDLITLMIGPSDNTATNAWIERLGIGSINARMTGMGLPHIHLFATIPALSHAHDDPSPWKGFRLGTVTPRELADWMGRVARGEVIDAESSKKIFDYLDKDPTRQRIARRFPSEMLWAGKSGSMRGVRNDAGVLRTKKGRFVLVVLTDGSKADPPNAADHPSVLAIGDVAKAIVDAWNKDLPDIVEKPK